MVWVSAWSDIDNERMDAYRFDSWIVQYNDVKCPVDKAHLICTAWISKTVRVHVVLSSRLPTEVDAELSS